MGRQHRMGWSKLGHVDSLEAVAALEGQLRKLRGSGMSPQDLIEAARGLLAQLGGVPYGPNDGGRNRHRLFLELRFGPCPYYVCLLNLHTLRVSTRPTDCWRWDCLRCGPRRAEELMAWAKECLPDRVWWGSAEFRVCEGNNKRHAGMLPCWEQVLRRLSARRKAHHAETLWIARKLEFRLFVLSDQVLDGKGGHPPVGNPEGTTIPREEALKRLEGALAHPGVAKAGFSQCWGDKFRQWRNARPVARIQGAPNEDVGSGSLEYPSSAHHARMAAC